MQQVTWIVDILHTHMIVCGLELRVGNHIIWPKRHKLVGGLIIFPNTNERIYHKVRMCFFSFMYGLYPSNVQWLFSVCEEQRSSPKIEMSHRNIRTKWTKVSCILKEWQLRASIHEVPSPTHVSKSQHGGKVPTLEPQTIIKIWLIIIKVGSWLFYDKTFTGLALRVGFSLMLDPANACEVFGHSWSRS
jgi:hypothetical protein